jgi:hypothetical protein
MYRVLHSNGEYRNLDLSESQFVDITTGADTELGVAVWNPETFAYVRDVTAEQAVLLYPVCWRAVYP